MGQAGVQNSGSVSLRPQVSEEQFDRAFDLLCSYEAGEGFALRDVLAAVLTLAGAELPSSIVTKDAMSFLREFGEPLA